MKNRWYSLPETSDNHNYLKPIERLIYDDILKLREPEELDPSVDVSERKAFLKQLEKLSNNKQRTGYNRIGIGHVSLQFCTPQT